MGFDCLTSNYFAQPIMEKLAILYISGMDVNPRTEDCNRSNQKAFDLEDHPITKMLEIEELEVQIICSSTKRQAFLQMTGLDMSSI